MAKVELNESLTVTASSIEAELAKVNYLLEGRLDNANFSASSVTKEYISDIALNDNKPVEAHKFIGCTTTEFNDGESAGELFTRTAQAIEDNPDYILFTGTGLIALNSNSNILTGLTIDIPKPTNFLVERDDDGEYKIWVTIKTDFDLTSAGPGLVDRAVVIESVSVGDDVIVVKIDKAYEISFDGAGANDFFNIYATVYAKGRRIL